MKNVILFFACLVLISVKSSACMCIGDYSSVRLEHFEKYKYIALAEIDTSNRFYYKFHVIENFKNTLPQILIYPRGGNNSCSEPIGWAGDEIVGKDWLLYFNEIDDSARIDIHQCGRSRGYNFRLDSLLILANKFPVYGSTKSEIDFLRVCSQNFKKENLHEKMKTLQQEQTELEEKYDRLKIVSLVLGVLLMIVAPYFIMVGKSKS